MAELLVIALAGLAGGGIRGMVGVLKALRMGRKPSARYFATTLLMSALIGLIAGMFVEADPRFAVLAGYAGSDFIEGLYRAEFRRYKKSRGLR